MASPVSAPPALSFFVPGTPQPKGSLHQWHKWMAGGRCLIGISEDTGAKGKEWRALVATAAKRAMGTRPPFEGPVEVKLTFFFERPKSHTRAQRLCSWMDTRPDGDKLERMVNDACTDAAIWGDDAQVVAVHRYQCYADAEGETPGVVVRVEALS